MPRKIPPNILRKLYSKSVDAAFLTVLEIVADEENPIYLVNNHEDIVYNGQTYTATRFTLVLPDDSPDYIPSSTIVFADMYNQFLDLVRNYDSISVRLEIIAAGFTSTQVTRPKTYSSLIRFWSSDVDFFSDTEEEVTDLNAYIRFNAASWNSTLNYFSSTDTYFSDEVEAYERYVEIETYETKVGPYNMVMSNASGDASTATFEISIDDIGQYAFPKGKFTPTDFPSLF